MGLLSNLYQRSDTPGDLAERRPTAIVQAATLAPALHGIRVEIARWARRTIPYGLDIESGLLDGQSPPERRGGYLPAPRDYVPGMPPDGTGEPPTGSPNPLPGGGSPQPSCCAPQPEPSAPGYLRTLNLQITADTLASDPSFEVRLTPAFAHPFRIRKLEITPLAGVQVGQYLDVLVTSSSDMSDAAAFEGSSVFEPPSMLGDIPTPDNQRALAVPVQAITFGELGPIFAAGQLIKLVQFFTAPAIALAKIGVTLAVEELTDNTPLPPARVPPPLPVPRIPPISPPTAGPPPTLPPWSPPGFPGGQPQPGPQPPPGTPQGVPAPPPRIITMPAGYTLTGWASPGIARLTDATGAMLDLYIPPGYLLA